MVPPMAVSGMENVIVNEALAPQLKPLRGVSQLIPVIKEKVVRLDWSTWKVGNDDEKFVSYGEPEDIIASGVHDNAISEEIGSLFEVVLENDGLIDEGLDEQGQISYTFLEPPLKKLDFFKAATIGGFGIPVGSMAFITSLPNDAIRWLEFKRVQDPMQN